MVLFPYSFHTQQPPHRPISESKPHEQCLISLEIRRLRRFPRSQVQDAHRVFSCVLVLVWGVLLLCSCSCCVSCVGVGFFSSCLCSFFLCLSFLFLVFFLFFFLFVVVFRLSGSVPVPPGFGRSVRFARKVPLRSRANVAGGPFRPDSARHGSTRIRIDKRRNMFGMWRKISTGP